MAANFLKWGLLGIGVFILASPKSQPPVPNDFPTGGGGSQTPTGSDYPIEYMKYSAAAKPIQLAVGTAQDGKIGPLTLAAIRKYLPTYPQTFSIKTVGERATLLWSINAVKQSMGNGTLQPTGMRASNSSISFC